MTLRPRKIRAFSARAGAVLLAAGAAAGLAGLGWAAPPARSAPPPLLLTGARLLDPAGEQLLAGQDLLVEGGRIARIGPAGSLVLPEGGTRFDLAGLVLLPGLIDLHSHLLLHPYDETPWDDQVLREALELRTIRGVVAARATLEAGFTTVRDLGTEGAGGGSPTAATWES